jgi:hypothetical protein
MRIESSAAILASLLLSTFGCAAPSADDAASTDQAAVSESFIAGEYEIEAPDKSGTLTITSASPMTFDLTVVRRAGGGSFGDLSKASVKLENGRAVFREGDDCTLSLSPGKSAVTIAQTGTCQDAGFGAFVDASGTYKRKAQTADAAAGTYTLKNAHIGATLTVARTAPFTFDLTAVMKPSTNFGDIEKGIASVAGKVATYNPDPDCELTFEMKADAIVVRQKGSCSEQGFGAFVDVSGTYGR